MLSSDPELNAEITNGNSNKSHVIHDPEQNAEITNAKANSAANSDTSDATDPI